MTKSRRSKLNQEGGFEMMRVYEFGFNPYAEFEKGGLLEGFDQDAVTE
jgi:hypothetical protein